MSANALRTIWSFFALILFGFTTTAVIRTSGAPVEANLLPLGTTEPYSAALLAFPILAALYLVLLFVTRAYADHPDVRTRDNWAWRIPVFYFDAPDINVDTADGRLYQLCVVVIFLVLPLLAGPLLLLKCLSGTAYLPSGAPFASGWRHFLPAVDVSALDVLAGSLRFGDSQSGVSYFPLLSPYLYLCAELWTLWSALHTTRVVKGTGGRHRDSATSRIGTDSSRSDVSGRQRRDS